MAKENLVDLSAGNDLPLGSRIRIHRQSKGIRLSAVAREIGYDRGYLSRIENNKAIPSDELLDKIARHLETSVIELRDGAVSKVPGVEGLSRQGRKTMVWAAPRLPPRHRTVGERVERLISAAHLTDDEFRLLEGGLLAMTGDLLRVIKGSRDLNRSVLQASGEEVT